MKLTQKLTIFASSLVLILLVVLAIYASKTFDTLESEHKLQLSNNQFQAIESLFNSYQKQTSAKTNQYLASADKLDLLSNDPSFASYINTNNQVEFAIFRTADNVVANQLPNQFELELTKLVEAKLDVSCCQFAQMSPNRWVMLSVVPTNNGIFVFGEMATNYPILASIKPATAENTGQVTAYLLRDAFTAQALNIELTSANQFSYTNLSVFIIAVACITAILFGLVILGLRQKPDETINRLKQEVNQIGTKQGAAQRVNLEGTDSNVGELAGSINDMLGELFAAKEFNKVTLNSIGDAVITTDLEGNITFCNAATYKIIKRNEDDLIGFHVAEVLPFSEAEDAEKLKRTLNDVIVNGHETSHGRCMHKLNRELEVLYVEKHITLLKNQAQQSVGTVMVLRDMTQSERLRKKLDFQASYDIVTKLLNRHKYEELLNDAVHSAKMERREHVLCQIDLDRFKLINDSAGHAAGDQLLYEVGTLFRSFLRKTDVCARIGGDEYGIILFDAHLEHGLLIFEKIIKQVKDYRFIWGGKVYSVGASIGVTVVNANTLNAAEARREADAACYMAKGIGQNNIRVFDSNNESLNSHHQAPRWAARINEALVNDRFELFFQRINPTVGVSEREHVEILLRMKDDDGSLLLPGMFLPAAERFRLTPKIDRWVIKNVFAWISSRPSLWDTVTLSVNLSGESLNDENLFPYIIGLHEKIGFPAKTICFEVTETAAVANLVVGRELITKLQSHGFTFALDDFGKGFSSYSYLQNLPAEYVKIDGGFVKEMTANSRDKEIVRSIHQISNVMGMKTIAEYVEDDSIISALKEIGVDYVQGFGVQRPAELGEFKPLSEVINSTSAAKKSVDPSIEPA